MTRPQWVVGILSLASQVALCQLPPGYVDPRPVLEAAGKAIGVDNVECITMSGTGYAGMVGQQRESAWNVDWPRGEPLANYTRTMNWRTASSADASSPPCVEIWSSRNSRLAAAPARLDCRERVMKASE